MTLNFPDSPSTGDIYNDSTSGFQYEWNGTVWISTDPQRAANIKELDDISGSFNGSTTQFNLRVSSSAVEPVSDAQLLISVGGVMQNPTNDYTVVGSTITFTTAPSAGLTFFGTFLGQSLSLNTIADDSVSFSSLKTGTAGVGIQSAGSQIGVGITNLNFIGTGNTFVAIGNTVNVSVNVGGIDTTGTSHFTNIIASGNLNVTGDLVYDEVTAVNQKISGVTTTTGLDVLGITSTKDLRSVGVTTLTSAGITNLTVSAASTFTGAIDANGGADISGGAGLVASSAKVSDLTSGRVTYAGGSGELQDNAGLTFDGTTLAATRLAAPVAFTTSLTAANVDVTGITTIRDDLTLKGAAANITFDKSTDDLIFDDGAKAIFGSSSDGLEIYHNGSHSYLEDSGTGDLNIISNTLQISNAANNEFLARFVQDGATELYYNSVKTFETVDNGIKVVASENNHAKIQMHADDGDDSADKWLIMATTQGQLRFYHGDSSENTIVLNGDAAVELYHDNSKKLNTTSVGVNVTGNVDCDSINNAGITTLGGALTGTTGTFSGDITANGNIVGDNSTDISGINDATISTLILSDTIAHTGDTNTKIRFPAADTITAETGGSERCRIDSSGRVLINTTVEGRATYGEALTIAGSGHCGMTIRSGDDSYGIIHFSDGTSGAAEYDGMVEYLHGASPRMRFFAGGKYNIVCNGGGSTELNHNENKKLETTSSGVTVTGTVAATSYTGDGSSLTGVGASTAPMAYNPPVSSTRPATVGVALTFNQQVKAGSGNINLRQVSTSGTITQAFTVTDATEVAFAQRDLREMSLLGVNELLPDSVYCIDIPASAIDDSTGSYVGTAYTFYTQSASLKLMTWGRNNTGQLAQPDNISRSSPIQIADGSSTWKYVPHGHTEDAYCAGALKADNTLWAWGYNQDGVLGQNQAAAQLTQVSSPVQVPGTNWNGLNCSVNQNFWLATKTDGTMWTWGRNTNGELGHNNRTSYSSPNQIPGTTWSSTSQGFMNCGGYYSGYSTKTDGTLWAWGNNGNGRLGVNNTTNYSSPKQIPGTTWKEVAANDSGAGSIRTDGTLWVWGRGDEGQNGQSNTSTYSSPKQIPGTTWTQLSGFHQGWIATKTDGTIWAWGQNEQGQLGQNDKTQYSSPRQVGSDTSWISARANRNNAAIATKTDGTLWTWGSGSEGVTGHNKDAPTGGTVSSPVQIPGKWTNTTAAPAQNSIRIHQIGAQGSYMQALEYDLGG